MNIELLKAAHAIVDEIGDQAIEYGELETSDRTFERAIYEAVARERERLARN